MKHTDTPWRTKTGNGWHHIYIVGEHVVSFEKNVATVPTHETGFADAEFIVKAVNSHYPMIAALEGLIERYTGLVNSGDAGNWDCEKEDAVIAARAALSLAKST